MLDGSFATQRQAPLTSSSRAEARHNKAFAVNSAAAVPVRPCNSKVFSVMLLLPAYMLQMPIA
jgi:hypothetical protein